MPNNLKKIAKSFTYAFKGWRSAFKTQLNFRVQCFLAVVAVALGFFLKISTNEWLWISLNITLVLFAEMINTALETLVDLVSPDYNEKAGRVKDIAAGAVTITAINAALSGLYIFTPKLLSLLR
jgi:diacylglycerol kinase